MRNRIYVFLNITWCPNQEGFLQFSSFLKLQKKPSWFFVDFNPSMERIKGDFEMDYAK